MCAAQLPSPEDGGGWSTREALSPQHKAHRSSDACRLESAKLSEQRVTSPAGVRAFGYSLHSKGVSFVSTTAVVRLPTLSIDPMVDQGRYVTDSFVRTH